MEISNENTEECEVKGKIKLLIDKNTVVLTDVYYLKESNDIISLIKFISKGYKVIGKGYLFQIFKDNQSII